MSDEQFWASTDRDIYVLQIGHGAMQGEKTDFDEADPEEVD